MSRNNLDFSQGVTPSYAEVGRAVREGKVTYEEGAELHPEYKSTLKSNAGLTGKPLPKSSDANIEWTHKRAGLK
jgi:hypothetical protein